jgi:hypothetical protein
MKTVGLKDILDSSEFVNISQQLQRAGVTMRRGTPARPATTQQILELGSVHRSQATRGWMRTVLGR